MFSKKAILETMEEIGCRLTVVSIDPKNPERRGTIHSGCNLFSAMETMSQLNLCGVRFLLCIDLPIGVRCWEVEPYREHQAKFPSWFGRYDHSNKLNAGDPPVLSI